MEPPLFQPATDLDEANQRLVRLLAENANLRANLEGERARVKRMTPKATPEQEAEVREWLTATDWRDASADLREIIADLRADDGGR